MATYSRERPGWYRDPDDPRMLRYWDGSSWTGKSRRQPPWATRAVPFEASHEEFDRSTEGPVHPQELREPVASGVWSREWLAWRAHPTLGGWHRRGGPSAGSAGWPARPPAQVKLGPARRPLLALVCLVVVALAVVASSVAVMSPYARREVRAERATLKVEARFETLADKACQATLPKYREALAAGTDGPAIAAAAFQVDLLRKRLSSLKPAPLASATVSDWLADWVRFTSSERRYAAIIGSPTWRAKHLVDRPLSPSASRQAARAHEQARQDATVANQLGTNSLDVPNCQLPA